MTIDLRAVIFRSGDHWMAQCLERDIAVQASAVGDLPDQLERAILSHVVIARDNGFEPFQSLPKAPHRYWEMFDAGLAMAPTKRRAFEPHETLPEPHIREMRIADRTEQLA